MLKDIAKTTRHIFKEFIPTNEQIHSPRNAYDVYRALQELIDRAKLVSEHYLVVDFSDENLQNSSWGEPSDKWRRFFNEDLESLNKSIKKYLHKLSYLALKDEQRLSGGFMSEMYRAKTFYAFVRDEYNVGFVEPCGFQMISAVLDTKADNETSYIEKFKKTDLATYEQREALQTIIREHTKQLEENLDALKSYIKTNYTLDDLM